MIIPPINLSASRTEYAAFLERKSVTTRPSGFDPSQPLCAKLFDFQRDVVRWALRRGRAALFEDCGLGKTPQQLIWADQVHRHTGGKILILVPLAVADQTVSEGEKFGVRVQHCRTQEEIDSPIVVTNYERLHRFDPDDFSGVVLDESSILKSYDGKFRTQILETFSETPYKLACTATPAPNDHMELGNHAEFVGAMTRTEMLSTYFVHDGGDTSKWRLKKHAEQDFWRWVCSWAVHIRRPSDLGYDDNGFVLPELRLQHHTVEAPGLDLATFKNALTQRRAARKNSLPNRIARAAELANSNNEQWLVWCDLNAESAALARAIRGAIEVTGSDSEEKKSAVMLGFARGDVRVLVTKPKIAGFGMNWQGSHNQIFAGLSDSYEQFYQAVRRQYRFGQQYPVDVHIITSALEQAVLDNIQRKQADADRMAEAMVKHMAAYSSGEIRGTQWTTSPYQPTVNLNLPSWMAAREVSLSA